MEETKTARPPLSRLRVVLILSFALPVFGCILVVLLAILFAVLYAAEVLWLYVPVVTLLGAMSVVTFLLPAAPKRSKARWIGIWALTLVTPLLCEGLLAQFYPGCNPWASETHFASYLTDHGTDAELAQAIDGMACRTIGMVLGFAVAITVLRTIPRRAGVNSRDPSA